MFSLRTLLAAISLSLLLATMAVAQQPQHVPPPNDSGQPESSDRMGRKQRGHRSAHGRAHGQGLIGLEGELALTEIQKEQLRAIHQKRFESTKSLREELFTLREKRRAGTITEQDGARARTLHEEMRASMESVKSEVEGILTPAQRAKVEDLQLQRKQRRAERMEHRREFRKNEQQ